VIGFGRIGREVAARCRAFGMEVQAFDPFVSAAVAEQAHVKLRSLEEVLQTSDYLTLHTTLTKETKHLLGKDALAKVKPGVRIVNAARGELIDDEALLAALEGGRVAGAGLDVHARSRRGTGGWRSTRRSSPCPPGSLDEGGPGAGGHRHRAAGARLPEGRRHPVRRQLLLAGGGPLRPGAAGHGPRRAAGALPRQACRGSLERIELGVYGDLRELDLKPSSPPP